MTVISQGTRPRIAFFVEGQLGHATHGGTLRRALARRDDTEALWFTLDARGRPGHKGPRLIKNWTLTSSVLTRRSLGRISPEPDAIYVHTPPLALGLGRYMRHVPTVLSTDATPRNMDELGAAYRHEVGRPTVERAKHAVTQRVYKQAAVVICFSEWARRSVVNDYQVGADRVIVLSPGVDLDAFAPEPQPPAAAIRMLFVGTDFVRKGGDNLLAALPHLRGEWSLDIVTRTAGPTMSNVRWHTGVEPNSEQLFRRFREADLLVFPTQGDAYGFVVLEAMAAGLPVISTDLAAIPELVEDGTTGIVTPSSTAGDLARAIQWMIDNPHARTQMGLRGRDAAERRFDARRNSDRIIDLLHSLTTSAR